jgi:DNA primase
LGGWFSGLVKGESAAGFGAFVVSGSLSLQDFASTKRLILDRVGILDVVSSHVALKRNGRRWIGLCPFHSEKSPSFTVSPDRGFFKCFGCGKGGDVFSFVQLKESVDFGEALRILADRAGVELKDRSHESTGGVTRTALWNVNAFAAEFFRSNLLHPTLGEGTRVYVQKRGISDEIAARFGLGLAVDGEQSVRGAALRRGTDVSVLVEADLLRQAEQGRTYDTFRNRLMFPIREAVGRVIGFGGRTLGDDPAKYLNTRQNSLFDKGRNLYGIDLARESIVQRKRAILVEGYTDCIAAHQAGFTETAASLGTALTEHQVELLRRYADVLILLFDSDQAGQAAAERAIRVAVPRGMTVKLARIPEGKDPCDYLMHATAEQFAGVLNQSVGALEFAWLQMLGRYRGDASDSGRRQAILDFLRLIAEASDSRAVDDIQRGLLANQVAHLLRIDREEAYRLIAKQRSGPAPVQSAGPAVVRKNVTGGGEDRAAWIQILGVLLNEPGAVSAYADLRAEVPNIADPTEQRIAMAAFDLLDRIGEFHFADLASALSESAEIERAAEIAQQGAERSNYANTMLVAAERLRRSMRLGQLVKSKQRIMSGSAGRDPAQNEVDRDMSALHAGLGEGHPFLPVRWRRRLTSGGEAPLDSSGGQPAATE